MTRRKLGCPICEGGANLGWVCEDHPDKPMEHDDCGGAGARCVCNPFGEVDWAEVYCEVTPDDPPLPEGLPAEVEKIRGGSATS
jgi:hypothetical protein